MTDSPETQFELWNGDAAARWIQHQEALDHVLAPFDRVAIDVAAPQPGESVLEVGCGCGASTMALAQAVGASGQVFGIDISRPMLQRARERTAGWSNVTLRQGDAGSYTLPEPVTLIYSRFGVMFFDDPGRAFANLRAALGLGGRLCFVCWRALEDNPWLHVQQAAASSVIELPPAPSPQQPGPFSLASEDRIRALLAGVGFEDVAVHRHDTTLALSSNGLEPALTLLTEAVGPLSRMWPTLDEPTQDRVREAMRAALRPHQQGDRVSLGASAWVVLAR